MHISNNNQSVPTMYTLKQIPSEAKIKRLVRKILFGSHTHCPRCKSRRVYRSEERYRCRKCRRPFSLTSNTWLSNMKLSWQEFYLILWCWLNDISIQQTERIAGLSELSIRRWQDKFKLNIPNKDLFLALEGNIQMDEAYFKNKSLMAAKDTGNKKIKMSVLAKGLKNVHRADALRFIADNVKPDSLLNTDGGGIYRGIDKWWPVNHQYERHSKWEFGITSEIEGTFGNLRTFIRRKYHHVTCSKLPLAVAEFQAKFNHPEIFETPDKYLENSLYLVPTC